MKMRGGDDDTMTTTTEASIDSSTTEETVAATTIYDTTILKGNEAASSSLLVKMLSEIFMELSNYMKGTKLDSMILLLTTALNAPFCTKVLGVSPILGFLALGLLFGPNGFSQISDIHTTEMLADLGIVMFLFEMGLHLDFKTLLSMKTDVFGIGLTQFVTTTTVFALICGLFFKMNLSQMIIVGWSLTLSSSAFVLQLLKDKNEMMTQYGKSSFGTLLLQDLMVVPLLVMTPLLAGGGGSVKDTLLKALLQLTLALTVIGTFGKVLLNPLLDFVIPKEEGQQSNQEAIIGMILAMVFGFSFLTEGLGLSNTLGPFLTGMLVAEKTSELKPSQKHKIEFEASPYRGILIGLFFFTVGFEIDLKLIGSIPFKIMGLTGGILAVKTILATLACCSFGLPLDIAQRVGLVISQGGEFAFVAFRMARSKGILTDDTTKVLLTCVSLTMALTPLVESLGAKVALKLQQEKQKKQK